MSEGERPNDQVFPIAPITGGWKAIVAFEAAGLLVGIFLVTPALFGPLEPIYPSGMFIGGWIGLAAWLVFRLIPNAQDAALKRSRFHFSLRTLFVVVTVFACWLGWNVKVVRHRQAIGREIVAEARARERTMMDFHYGGTFVWRSEHVQHRPKEIAELSRVRRWLGDQRYTMPILRSTKSDALRTKAAFPEAEISYYAGPYSNQYSDWVEAIFRATPGVYVMDADGRNFRLVVKLAEKWSGSPSFSPNGKTLIFDAWPLANYAQAHIYATAPERPNSDLTDLGLGNTPAWSPDGKQIAFCVYKNDPNRIPFGVGVMNAHGTQRHQIPFGVWVMNADGTERHWICDGRSPRWSPDGNWLTLINNPDGKGDGHYLHNLRKNESKAVLDRTYREVGPAAWAGQRLAFIGRNGVDDELVIVTVDGDERKLRVRLTGKLGWRPSWSPDGKYIMCGIARPDGRQQLHRIEVDTMREPELLAHQDEGRLNSNGSWSPDGKQIVFTSNR